MRECRDNPVSVQQFLTMRSTESSDAANTTINGDHVEDSNILQIGDILGNVQLHDSHESGLVDTCAAIASLVDSLSELPNNPPSTYIDLEGVNLSRHGTISILQLHVLPEDKTYLIDVHPGRKGVFDQRNQWADPQNCS